MRRERMEAERRRVRDGRAALAGLLGLSLVANLGLSVGLSSVERMAVLIPRGRGAFMGGRPEPGRGSLP